ncbi:MAG: thiamine diphosphokinase [Tissierellia bacterium]|nr:thiamine diphosphokinase [Tissierellia bacterium]
MSGICYIVGASPFGSLSFSPDEDDLVIAADAGFKYLIDKKIKPDVIVGDFDTLNLPDDLKGIKLKKLKDTSDLYEALDIAFKKGFKKCYVYKALGGRISHTLANISHMMYFFKKGVDVHLFNDDIEIFGIDSNYCFEDYSFNYISIFPFTESANISIENLKYELKDHELKKDIALGLSNEFIGLRAKIYVNSGSLIIVKEKRDEAILKIIDERKFLLINKYFKDKNVDKDLDLWIYQKKDSIKALILSKKSEIIYTIGDGNYKEDLIEYIKYHYENKKF